MKSLIIAEKPSLAMTIKNSIRENFKKFDGYFESENYIVSFVFGHIFEPWSIEDYLNKPEGTPWNLKDIPFIPDEFKWKLKKDSPENIKKNKVDGYKKQYTILEKLINRPDVDVIFNGGDSDREGCVIVNNTINEALKDPSKTIKRLWLPEQTEDTIRQALNNAKPNSCYDNLYNEGKLRTIQDYLIGIQLSRYVSLIAKKKLPVGRVLGVVVKAIYDRDLEIKNFQSQTYFNIKGSSKDKSITYTVFKTDKNLEISAQKTEANNIMKLLYDEAIVVDVKVNEVIKNPKKLFSLDTLQNKMSKDHKFSPTKTLSILQGLYQKGFTTYPRTNTEYLSSNEKNRIEKIIDLLKVEHKVEINDKKSIFDDSKIESHSAITITTKIPKESELSSDEQLLYSIIKNRFISNFLIDKAILNETIIVLEVGENLTIDLKGKSIKQKGYLEYENDIKDTVMPNLQTGDKVSVNYSLEEAKTKPKAHMSIEELNNYLKNPFKKETDTEDEEYKNILDGLEIGTVATRGAIIDNALKYGYITLNKDKYLITDIGIKYIDLLNELNIDLYKEKTVEFSKKLKKVYKGEATVEDGIEQIRDLLTEYIKKDVKVEVDMSVEKEVIGKCPRCGKNVYEGTKNFYCEGYKDEPKCEFTIWKENKFFSEKGKKVTKAMASKFLKDKIVTVKNLKKKDGSSTYNAKIEMIDTPFNNKLYVNFKILEFVK